MLYDPTVERFDEINENLSLIQRRDGLLFGTDSYLLAAFARPIPDASALELGGGCGAVSLLAASRGKFLHILSAEIQPEYADLITRNAALNGLSDRITTWRGDIRDLRLPDVGGGVRAVLSNPPYLKSGSGFGNRSDEMNAARREEHGTIRDFAAAASRLLDWGGFFSVVYRPERAVELFAALREVSLEPKRAVWVYPSLADGPCLLLVEAKKGAGEGLKTARPLIIYRDKAAGVYTDDMQGVYDRFSLEHVF